MSETTPQPPAVDQFGNHPEPQNLRAYFRLEYPRELMPTIVIGTREFAVPEISEYGFRIRCQQFDQFKVGDLVKGIIHFSDGTSLAIISSVYRRDHKEFVLQPSDQIPYKRILDEQRRIIKQFGTQS